MGDPRFIRSAPEIPDEGQPFILRRTALVWIWLSLPAVWLIPWMVVLLLLAINPGGGSWGLLGCVLPIGAIVLFGAVLNVQKVTGIWLAANHDGVWVSARQWKGTGSFGIWVPWGHIESIFAVQANRDGGPRGAWNLVVRVKGLPSTLRPPEHRESDRATFPVPTWLSNYRAEAAIGVLARLAAGRAPVG